MCSVWDCSSACCFAWGTDSYSNRSFSHIINVDTDGDDIAHLQPLGDTWDDDEMSVDDDNGLLDDLSCLEVQKHASKKKRQWMKWNDDVIPALLRPYVDLLYKTENF